MAAMWFGSLVPWPDANGDPYVGALVEFFDEATTTPQVVYTDASLSTPAGPSDRTANSRGAFPALFLNPDPGSYRVKITASDGTVIEDVDGISVPQDATYVPPETGDTDVTLLFRTGDLKPRYDTGAHSGWVRANGRTIGSATSGASERANADCEDLFEHLWTVDSTLSVSGGRGATAAGDWGANKTIALPDLRGRAPVGLDDMGNSAAGRVTSLTTLGKTGGAQSVTLVAGQIPQLSATSTAGGNHGHPFRVSTSDGHTSEPTGGLMLRHNEGTTDEPAYTGSLGNTAGQQIGASGTHTHDVTVGAGSPSAVATLPPHMGVTVYIKL